MTPATTRVVISGAGAAGVAVARILLAAGITDLAVTDRRGVLHSPEATSPRSRRRSAEDTADGTTGTGPGRRAGRGRRLHRRLRRHGPRGDRRAHGAATRSSSALANPDPEVHPDVAHRHARVVATGRSDFPNQINNVLAFPGIFRGAFDARAPRSPRG